MISIEKAMAVLRAQYPDMEAVASNVVRCVDTHDGKPYAVRYFDLRDDIRAAALQLQKYQDELLGESYFAAGGSADLRWNHYLYFVASASSVAQREFQHARASIEANREYARKVVLTEDQLAVLIARVSFGDSGNAPLPPDAMAVWASVLEQNALSYVVDETLQVPMVVKRIADGNPQGVARVLGAPPLDSGEAAAAGEFLRHLQIDGFREHPRRRSFEFGRVNLVSGVNGVGKTSLLEAIEFLFCGQTRRTQKAPRPQTTVRGTWAVSGGTLTTSDNTTRDRLRARHLAWYGKSELRTLTLSQSFGKFNFLDTDAAVHLSVEGSRERLKNDLFQLLLGAESSKAMDRLTRVTRQLEEVGKSLDMEQEALDLRRVDADRRITELRAVRQQSDELFNALSSALRGVGWRRLPVGKRETTALEAAIQATMRCVRLLASRNTRIPTSGTLEAEAGEALRQIEVLTKERDAAVAMRVEARAAELAGRSIRSRLAALDELATLVASEVRSIGQRRDALKRQHADSAARVTNLDVCVGSVPSELLGSGSSISEAIQRWESMVGEAVKAERAAQDALNALERAQAAITNVRQQLRAAALQLMRHTLDEEHCPVCHTEFSRATLSAHLARLETGIAADEVDRLRAGAQSAAQVQRRRRQELEAIRALAKCAGVGPDTPLSVVAAELEKTRREAALVGVELAAAEMRMREFESKGWSVARLEELSVVTGFSGGAVSSEAVDEVRARVKDELNTNVAMANYLGQRARESEERAIKFASANGFNVATIEGMLQVATERWRAIDVEWRAVRELEAQLDPSSANAAAELEVQVTQAHELVMRLRAAIEQEAQRGDALVREGKISADASTEIGALRVKRERVDKAHRVIVELLETQSERALVDRILRENAATIATTFAKIHSPNEFDVGDEEGLRIVRRADGGSVELEDMSSGQRAAYAMSLFFAMNARLKAGPKLIMLDDPVSHVDDINTLAFLDHLREVALTGARQVVFATADSKIASLFQRKFGFLGKEFRHIELTRGAE